MTPADNDRKEFRKETIGVDGTQLVVLRGGAGKPLLVLHEELGYSGWLSWHSALAKERSLVLPMHPGWGRTPRADWIASVRDLAGFYSRFVREQKLTPVDVAGFSLGGWIAAEMAAANPDQFRRMVLVAPAGLRPPRGDIFDFFQVMAPDHLRLTVLDPEKTAEYGALYGGIGPAQFESWEEARAQTSRVAWQPFMHNPSLGHLLGMAAHLPTLLIWGRDDTMVPLSAGEAYRDAIAGAKLVVLPDCGHRPEIEKPAEFIREVKSFLG